MLIKNIEQLFIWIKIAFFNILFHYLIKIPPTQKRRKFNENPNPQNSKIIIAERAPIN